MLLAVVVGSSLSASEKEAGIRIVNVTSRKSVSLAGEWKYIVDPQGKGLYTNHGQLRKTGATYFADKNPDSDFTKLIEYGFDRAESIQVPGDWNTQKEKLYYYEGCVWYRRTFDFNIDSTKRYFLHFDAVNHSAIVGLNGKKLARHEGGFTPFDIEITGSLLPKDNSVVVMADNSRSALKIPSATCDWWNYGGITRSVSIVEVPKAFISEYSVQTGKETVGKTRKGRPAKRRIHGYVRLDGAEAGTEVCVEIPSLNAKTIARIGEDGLAGFEMHASPILWEPGNPKLYEIHISSDQDSITDRIGFRYVETQGDRILLNGKPVFCRGVSIHEEAPYTNNRITSRAQDKQLLAWAQELGCNFVRLAHYPHNEDMLRLADELGLMVWSEIPVYWTIAWGNPSTCRNASFQLREMIKRDINRACIVVWSVANETPVSEARTAGLVKLIAEARSLDDTRLISAAMEKTELQDNVFTVDDPLQDYTDIISFNQYTGWYGSSPDKCDKVKWVIKPGKPVFISEFGAGAVYGRHGDKTERWTEEYMADCYEHNIRMMVSQIPGLAGTTPWALKDFRSPRRPLGGIQDDFNRKGLISGDGNKKQAFYILKDWYQKLAAGSE